MAYVVLTEDDQDDMIVAFMLAQERDQFLHTVNKARYVALNASLAPSVFKTRIETLLNETNSRLTEVDAILAETVGQLPNAARRNAAITRLKAKGSI